MHMDLQRHGVIEASAGTGKTHTLQELVLRLLQEGKARLEEIRGLLVYIRALSVEYAAGRIKHPEQPASVALNAGMPFTSANGTAGGGEMLCVAGAGAHVEQQIGPCEHVP